MILPLKPTTHAGKVQQPTLESLKQFITEAYEINGDVKFHDIWCDIITTREKLSKMAVACGPAQAGLLQISNWLDLFNYILGQVQTT